MVRDLIRFAEEVDRAQPASSCCPKPTGRTGRLNQPNPNV